MIVTISVIALIISLYALGNASKHLDALYETVDAQDAKIQSLQNLLMDSIDTGQH